MSRERGVLIESHNPQPEVRKNAETAVVRDKGGKDNNPPEDVREPTDKVLKPGETVNISEEASEELDKEFERRRDWNAFYKDKYGPYPGSPPEEYEPDYGDMYDL